eukprot:TRINITY_DN46076_c0_g1_i1.p1 TRINITY_DN46076_c0_g1~~TRINITY_DN46076_c0_g1_i1.p1  ORF type:complete len:393 (+),score=53.07 TRINITY_DN46076_c0_g1_i1:105-1283(+)
MPTDPEGSEVMDSLAEHCEDNPLGLAGEHQHVATFPLCELADIAYAFVDLDGTGLNKRKVPSAGFWAAVGAFEATGGRVVTATGNAREAALVKLHNGDASGNPCPADTGGDGLFSSGADLSRVPGIYQNGAEVRGVDGAEISKTWLGNDILEKLVDWFNGLIVSQREQVGIAFQSYGNVYILSSPSPEVEVPVVWTAVRGDQFKLPSLEVWSRAAYFWGEGLAQALPYEELKHVLFRENVHCAMILTTVAGQGHWAKSALSALGELSDHVCHGSSLTDPCPFDRSAYTFTHPAADKGSGLKMLLEHFGGVDPKKVVALGDNLNDKSMLTVDGVLGIAVMNARDELKAVARAVTGSNEDPDIAGVAQALNLITEAKDTRAQSGGDTWPRRRVM